MSLRKPLLPILFCLVMLPLSAQYRVAYWFDSDYASQVVTESATPDISLDIPLPEDQKGVGMHSLRMQSINTDGRRGPVSSYVYFTGDYGQLAGYDWWLDNDPSSKTTVHNTTGTDNIVIDIAGLSPGMHVLTLRGFDNFGQRGAIDRFLFFTSDHSFLAGYEWWLDDNYAGRTTVHTQEADHTIMCPLGEIGMGIHVFNIRAFDTLGQRGTIERFMVITDNMEPARRIEYWWDNDLANSVRMDVSDPDINLTLPLADLKAGMHTFRMRGYNSRGQSGPISSHLVVIPAPDSERIAAYRFITDGVEYYTTLDTPAGAETLLSIPLPLVPLPGAAQLTQRFRLDGGNIVLSADDPLPFTLQLFTTAGVGLMPFEDSCPRPEIAETPSALLPFSRTEIVRAPLDGFRALRIDISEAASYYVRGSQRAEGILYRLTDGALSEPSEITPDELTAGRRFSFAEGTYYLVLTAMTDDTETMEVRLSDRNDDITATPEISFDNGLVTIWHPNPQAEIYYTLDGSEPTQEHGHYTTPFELLRNATVRARAYSEGNAPSDVASLTVDSYVTPAPSVYYDHLRLNAEPALETDTIYYTYGEPNVYGCPDRMRYTGPVELTGDGEYFVIAVREGFRPSESVRYLYYRHEHTVSDISVAPLNSNGSRFEVSCPTEGARIFYTQSPVGGPEPEVPTESSARYEGPIDSDGNFAYRFRAFADDMYPSSVAGYSVNYMWTDEPALTEEGLYFLLTPGRAGDTIWYTTDSSDPRDSDTRILYTGPIPMAGLPDWCYITACAERQNYLTSNTVNAPYDRGLHTVAPPAIDKSADGTHIEMRCSTEGAQIFYTTGSDNTPSAASTLYTEPIAVSGNVFFRAIALRLDDNGDDLMFPSPIVDFSIDDQQAGRPRMHYRALRLEITPDAEGDEIWYTTNGADPRIATERIRYTAPLSLIADCLVRAVATRTGFNTSQEAQYQFRRADHTAATPEIREVTADGAIWVEMYPGADESQVRYTVDDPGISETSPLYTGRIVVNGNHTYRAIAVSDTLFTSAVAMYEISDQQTGRPTCSYDSLRLTLTATHPDRESIWYTTNGNSPVTDPTRTRYTAPLYLESDCTVRYYATSEGYNDSPEGQSFIFRRADHTLANGTLTPDYDSREVTVSHPDRSVTLVLTSVEAGTTRSRTVENGETISVDPSMTSLSLTASDPEDQHFDSDTVTMALDFVPAPHLNHDGLYLTLLADGKSRLEIDYDHSFAEDFIGSDIDIDLGLSRMPFPVIGEVRATAYADGRFRSDTSSLEVWSFFDDRNFFDTPTAYVAAQGRLEDAFEWCGGAEAAGAMTDSLTLAGHPDAADLETLRKADGIRVLNLRQSVFDETEPLADGALAIPSLETVVLPDSITTGARLFAGADRLTAMIYEGDAPLAPSVAAGVSTDNLLLFVDDAMTADGSAVRNIVARTPDGRRHAAEIVLADGHRFATPLSFTADTISYSRRFAQTTGFDGRSRGWESIALPFRPATVTHERAGEIVPFAALEGEDDERPRFWLYAPDADSEWAEADAIEADAPYIIAMPCNPEYLPEYNLDGLVTFSAADVEIHPSAAEETEYWPSRSLAMAPNFMQPEGDDRVYALNVGRDDLTDDYGYPLAPGEAFVRGLAPAPFTAYIAGGDMSRRVMRVFGDFSPVEETTADDGLKVTVTGHKLHLLSGSDRMVEIFSAEGQLIKRVWLQTGVRVTVGELEPGIYIVARRKIRI